MNQSSFHINPYLEFLGRARQCYREAGEDAAFPRAVEVAALKAEEMLPFFRRQGLEGLWAFYYGIQFGENPLSRGCRMGALRAAMVQQSCATLVSQHFTAMGIRHLFLKGVVSDLKWWGGVGLRGAGDCDVLVEPNKEEEVLSVLDDLGFKVSSAWELKKASRGIGHDTEFCRSNPGEPYVLDVHWGRVGGRSMPRVGTEAWFDRASFVDCDGFELPCLGPEDMLGFMTVNLANSRFSGLVRLALDAMCWFEDHSERLEAVASEYRSCGYEWSLWALLELMTDVWGTESIGSPVLAEIQPLLGVRSLIRRTRDGQFEKPDKRTNLERKVLGRWVLSQKLGWPCVFFPEYAYLRWLKGKAQ